MTKDVAVALHARAVERFKGYIDCRRRRDTMHRVDDKACDCAVDGVREAIAPLREFVRAHPVKPRGGQRHEDEIDEALTKAGFTNVALFRPDWHLAYEGWYIRQFHFDPSRGWAFDFAFPFATPRFAIEREGGVHVIKSRKRKDDEKRRSAAALGWLVYPVTTVEEALEAARAAAAKE